MGEFCCSADGETASESLTPMVHGRDDARYLRRDNCLVCGLFLVLGDNKKANGEAPDG